MAAPSYFDAHPNAPRPLKPMMLSDSLSMNSGISSAKYDSLHHANNSQEALQHHDEILERVRFHDEVHNQANHHVRSL